MAVDSFSRVSANSGRKRAFPTSSRRTWKLVSAVTLSASFMATTAFQQSVPLSYHNSPLSVPRSSTAVYVLADPRKLVQIQSNQSVEDRAVLEELYLLSALAKKATRKKQAESREAEENTISTIKPERKTRSKSLKVPKKKTTIKAGPTTDAIYEEPITQIDDSLPQTPLAPTSVPIKAAEKVAFKGLTTVPNPRNLKKKKPLLGTLEERLAMSEDEYIHNILQQKEDMLSYETNEEATSISDAAIEMTETPLLSNILEVEAALTAQLPKGPSIVYSSRASTMPGIKERTSSDRYRMQEEGKKLALRNANIEFVEDKTSRKKAATKGGQLMYKTSRSVPDSLVQFANEIHDVDRITPEEEIQLGEKTQEALRVQKIYDGLKTKLQREPTDDEWCAASGKFNMEAVTQIIEEGLEAKNTLVTSNLRMVQGVVNVYIRNGIQGQYNAGDMMQEGIVALMRAAEKFDPSKGFRFSTYAMYWIRSAIKRDHCEQSRIVRVPIRLHETNKKIVDAKIKLKAELDREPTQAELSLEVGVSLDQLERVEKAFAQKFTSLDQTITNRNAGEKDLMKGVNEQNLQSITSGQVDEWQYTEVEIQNLRDDLFDAMSTHLTEEEMTVLKLKFGFDEQCATCKKNGRTITDVGRMLGRKPAEVRRIISQSLTKLERSVGDDLRYYNRDFCI